MSSEHPRVAEFDDDEGHTTLSVASFNAWCLPLMLSPVQGQRLRAWAWEAEQLKADVMVLQEVWHEAALAVVLEAVGAMGYEHVVNWGGMVLASKHPITTHGHTKFDVCGMPDRMTDGDMLVDKGVLWATLTPPGCTPVTVATTHTVAVYDDALAVTAAWRSPLQKVGAGAVPMPTGSTQGCWLSEHDVFSGQRAAQMVTLASALQAAAPTGPLILAGDLNMGPNSTGTLAVQQALGAELAGRTTLVLGEGDAVAPASGPVPLPDLGGEGWTPTTWAGTFGASPQAFSQPRELQGIGGGTAPPPDERLDHVLLRGVGEVGTWRVFDRLFCLGPDGALQGVELSDRYSPLFHQLTTPASQAAYEGGEGVEGAMTSWAAAERLTAPPLPLSPHLAESVGGGEGVRYITPSDHAGLLTVVRVPEGRVGGAAPPSGMWSRLAAPVRQRLEEQLADGVTGADERGSWHLLFASICALGMLAISRRMVSVVTPEAAGLQQTVAPAPTGEIPLPRRARGTPRSVPAHIPTAPGAQGHAPRRLPFGFKHTMPGGKEVLVASRWVRGAGALSFAVLATVAGAHGGMYYYAKHMETPALQAALAAVQGGV